MPSVSATYASITNSVGRLVTEHAENDRSQAAYMICRAAVLLVRIERGDEAAAEMMFRLGDEMVGPYEVRR